MDFLRVEDVLGVAARLTAVWAFSFVVGDDGVPKVEWTSDDVASQLGYSPNELAESGWIQLVIPEDRPAVEAALRTARDGRTASFELRVLNRKGKLRRVRGLMEGKPDSDGTIRRLIGAGHDVTERFEAQRCQDLAVRVAHVLADTGSSDVAVVRLLEAVGAQLEAEVGLLWRVDSRTRKLYPMKTWSTGSALVMPFIQRSHEWSFEIGEGLPGRAWQSRRAIVIPDVAREVSFRRADAAVAGALRGAYAFPILNGSEFVGVLEMLTRAEGEVDQSLVEMMDDLGSRIGHFLRRREAEEALRQSESLRKAVFDACPDCIITADDGGRIVDVNEASEAILGISRGALIGRPLVDVLKQDDVRALIERVLTIANSTGLVSHEKPALETRLVRDDGGVVPVTLTLHAVPGQPVHVAVYLQDLREVKALQDSIRQRDDAIRDFIDNGTIGLHWVRADETIEWANHAELALLGYSRDEYLGRCIRDFHVDADAITDILTLLTKGEPLVNYPARLKAKDGSTRYVLINSSVLRRDGAFVRTRCFSIPVTESMFWEFLRERSGVPESFIAR